MAPPVLWTVILLLVLLSPTAAGPAHDKAATGAPHNATATGAAHDAAAAGAVHDATTTGAPHNATATGAAHDAAAAGAVHDAAAAGAVHDAAAAGAAHDAATAGAAHDGASRTGYHFQPRRNWMNDPNAPMYYKGWYHLFYQYNPKGAIWGKIFWGHSVSRDLINWVALKPALSPSSKADKYGCWSGSATMLPDGTPAIMYTGIIKKVKDNNYQVQNMAYPRNRSDPLLRDCIKPASNPVIVPERGMNATLFRDPTTAWHADGLWHLLIGSREGATRGVAYLYRSHDFKRWTRVRRPLHSAPTGMWECPDLFPVMVGGWQNGLDTSMTSSPRVKHVLKNSLDARRYDYYTVGKYDLNTERYLPDDPAGDKHHLRYDYGDFYASKTFYDPSKRRRILWGWANESDTVNDNKAKGWAGIQAIPRKVWLDKGGKQLLQWPVEEVETLRGKLVSLNDRVIKPGGSVEITGIPTAQADIEVTFEVPSMEGMEVLDPALSYDAQKLCSQWGADKKGGVGPFGLWVLASAKLEEKTAVFFRVFRAVGRNNTKPVVLMCTDPTRSSLSPNLYQPTFAGFVDTDLSQGTITLRSLIDRSVVESFGAGGRTCILSRVYPSLATGKNAHLHVFNNGKMDIKVSQLAAWEMKPALMNGAHI